MDHRLPQTLPPKCGDISVRNLLINAFLKLVKPAQKIGIAKWISISKEMKSQFSFMLNLKYMALEWISFELLTGAIVSYVAEFGGIDVNSLKEPDLAVSHLLKADSWWCFKAAWRLRSTFWVDRLRSCSNRKSSKSCTLNQMRFECWNYYCW